MSRAFLEAMPPANPELEYVPGQDDTTDREGGAAETEQSQAVPHACCYETVLHARGGNAERPYAHVTAVGRFPAGDASILAQGIFICGLLCPVKRRRECKRDRLAEDARRSAARQASQTSRQARCVGVGVGMGVGAGVGVGVGVNT